MAGECCEIVKSPRQLFRKTMHSFECLCFFEHVGFASGLEEYREMSPRCCGGAGMVLRDVQEENCLRTARGNAKQYVDSYW